MKAPVTFAGLLYQPRPAPNQNGNIGKYQVDVSSDGTNWGSAIATGTFADDSAQKTITFAAVTARYVRLTALTEAGNRGPFTNVAELNVLTPPPPTALPRTGWTVTADSQELVGENGAASNAIDGNPATYWHSQWSPTPTPLPHRLTIDMKAPVTFAGMLYQPRPAPNQNGNIGQYQINVSSDGTNWGSPVATGTFADDSTTKTITFAAVTARYVRLTALTEAGNRGPFTNVAELNLLTPTDPPTSGSGWTATADSQELVGENGAASNAIDGDPATYWHSQWRPTPTPLPHRLTIDMKAPVTFAGLVYQPRPAPTLNGNIGQYQINVSSDGTNWGSPVATGTFADDSTTKTITFPAVTVRYVRLTALTEAGNRGPFTNVAELKVLAVPTTDPAQGIWGPTIGFPLVPAAAAQLPDGRILTWSAQLPNDYIGGSGLTQTAILDPNTTVVTQSTVTNTQHDMFCPGTATLTDGRLMVTGGSDSTKTSIYDPTTGQWTAGPPMNLGRGYQGMTTLSDGRAFVLGGSWSGALGGKNAEVWSATDGWRLLPGVPVDPILTADPQGIYRQDNHGWFFSWSGNQVFHAGPSKQMNWFSTTGTGAVTPAGTRGDDVDAMNGNASMYDVGKILVVGGATAYQNADGRNSAYVIDINNGVNVRKVAPMAYARAFANSVVLPDGKVLVVGGQARAVPFSDDTSVLNAELWNPATETFTTMAAASVPRNYHSVALLLPDGRVFSGGGGMCANCNTNHPDGQIFTPPYLLNADGSPRPRPTITGAPPSVTAGGQLTVTTDRPVASYSLLRLGAVTHTVNNDQRRIPLTPTSVNGTTYTLDIPADRGVVLPGNYMLFALDAAGVPSVAKIVQII
jgi:galactose oxidase